MLDTTFPEVKGRNLNRKMFDFPHDFSAEFTIVLLAFYRNHQDVVDTWLPFISQLEVQYPNLDHYEFPVVYKMGKVRQFMLNEGMRAGIPDNRIREKTVTLYLDKTRFLNSLGIKSENEVQVMLISQAGKVVWREEGVFSSEKGFALAQFLMENGQLKDK